ncbi:MAG TPA: cytochrome c maturation protein CcmE [Chloroflexota bacterium]|nr:cytochrome c maturation protein CcmE [Chloroflexota bacterium]
MSEQTIERVGERARERTGDSVSRQVDGTHGPFAVSPTRPTAGPGADGWSGAPRRLEPGPASRARSVRVVVAVLIVVSAIGYLIYTGFQSTTVYYLTVSELKAKGPAAGAVRVAGIVQANTVVRSANDATVHFTIADQGGSLPVVYQGMVPDIFGPGIQVVVEGHYTAGSLFQADTLLAKCPSKFTAAVPTPVSVH